MITTTASITVIMIIAVIMAEATMDGAGRDGAITVGATKTAMAMMATTMAGISIGRLSSLNLHTRPLSMIARDSGVFSIHLAGRVASNGWRNQLGVGMVGPVCGLVDEVCGSARDLAIGPGSNPVAATCALSFATLTSLRLFVDRVRNASDKPLVHSLKLNKFGRSCHVRVADHRKKLGSAFPFSVSAPASSRAQSDNRLAVGSDTRMSKLMSLQANSIREAMFTASPTAE